MQVQAFRPNIAPMRSLKAPEQNSPVGAPETPTPPQDSAQVATKSWKPFLSGAGGALAGAAAAAASGAAVVVVSNRLGSVLNATIPTVSSVAPGTVGILLFAAGAAVLGGTVAGLASGARVGAQIAQGAAQGTAKPDITQSASEHKGVSKYQQSAAELQQNLSGIRSASSYKSAAAAGLRAGFAIGGPAGAAAGKIQGALLGAALGGVAGLPLMGLISHPAVLIPSAIAGAFLGMKIGEPIGYVAGAVALGSLGAAGGAVYHGVAGRG